MCCTPEFMPGKVRNDKQKMNYLSNIVFIVICLIANMIYAHGVHGTIAKAFYMEEQTGFLEFFIADLNASSRVSIKKKGGYRYIESDGLPDHATGKFPGTGNPNRISAQEHKFRMSLKPGRRRSPTFIRHSTFGVAINGIPFDPSTTEYWDNDASSPWNINAINGRDNPGMDQNNAHVQPNGAYHYHSIPVALMERVDQYSKPVLLGYAADGFPIYGPYSYADADDMSSELINIFPSYRLKEGVRPGGPGGRYDGTYTVDYEYVKDLGDLDQCNGREGVTPEYPDGSYYYVITDTWPFIPRCWMGIPDDSFRKVPGKTGNEAPKTIKEVKQESKPKTKRRRIDTRKYGIPARDARSACNGRRSGVFCSYRGTFGTMSGTCRMAGAKEGLTCTPIDR